MGRTLQQCLRTDARFFWCGGSTSKGDFNQEIKATTLPASQAECIVDFSSPVGNKQLLQKLQTYDLSNLKILLATTGLPASMRDTWKKTSKAQSLTVLFAPNTSIGIALLLKTALQAQQTLGTAYDIEITEAHHRQKIDAPSGTATYLAESLCKRPAYRQVSGRTGARQDKEIGVHALRGGSVYGEHTVHFWGEDEEFSISHRALNRRLFAKGALSLLAWLFRQKTGIYQLTDIT